MSALAAPAAPARTTATSAAQRTPQLRAAATTQALDRQAARIRRRTGPTQPTRPAPGLRLATGTAAGTVVPHPSLEGAQRPRDWDRLRFRPALEETGARAPALSAAAADLPDPARFAAVVVTAAAEVLSGQRRADHLARWTTPELFEALARRAGLARRLLGCAPTRLRPRSVHAQPPSHGTCEVTILLDDGARVRAAAARLETFRGRWLLAALEIA